MSHNLLTTKLYIPQPRKNLVPSMRLIQTLNDAWQQDKKLILVSASAGYGKTTLVAGWLAVLQAKSTWLSLDHTDNDPTHFLAYLIAALQRIDKSIGENTQAMLQSPQPLPPEVVLTALVNEIATVPTSFILVLDDYHLIEALPIHQHLDFLVEHQPPQLHLVIITREDPPLPLARLRARGQMVEIRQDDLRFLPEECADFLQRVMGLNLSGNDITALERHTEGWITGLQLAALSMQGRDDLPGFIEAFTGRSHYVLDYLIEEVFERQSAEEQDFLLRTSILDRLSGPLCDAVTGRTGSRTMLERLEHANLFIIPLDQSCTWYRYHQLFAELLRQRLHYTATLSENELHRLASQWFTIQGLLPEAIQHSLAASDWEMAAELVSKNSEIMLRNGELITLLGWLKSLPDPVVFQSPQLCQYYSWALTLTGRLDAAEIYLRQAEALAGDDRALLGTILTAKAYNQRARGDNPQAVETAQRALDLLPVTDPLSRGLVALTLGLAHMNCGRLSDAEAAFVKVDQEAQKSQNHYARMTALTYLAIIQAIHGRLHRAAELCQQVIQLGGQSPPVAPAYIELGAILYEWNDLEAAGRHLQIGDELSQRVGNLVYQSESLHTLAILQQACGEPGAANRTLQKADKIISERQVTPLTRLRNAACHVQLAVAQNDLDSAAYWAGFVTEPADSSLLYPQLELTPIRLLIAHSEKNRAAEKLKELIAIASQAEWGSAVIELRLLQALVAATPVDSLYFLKDALKMAQPEGFIRTFLDKGEPLRLLLERLKAEGGELKEYILALLATFGKGGTPASCQDLVEPLSEREIEILRLLAEGFSNRAIAERLVISVGTVKSHVHHILEKLGGNSRTQAVAKARELKLVL